MLKILFVLAIGAASGMLAHLADVPLPWLIGPLVVTAALSLAGVDVKTPPQMRKIGQLTAALSIGTSFSPEVVAGLGGYIGVIAVCAAASILAGVASAAILARLTEVKFNTSYFASMPGGVAEMSVLAERYGGDTALVAVAQSLRIIIVVLTIPVALVLLGGGADSVAAPASPLALQWDSLALMALVALVLGWVLDSRQVINAFFLAGLVVGGFAILGPVPLSSVPHGFVDAAQVLIGVALGGRVDPRALRQMRRFLPMTVAGTLLLIAFNCALAWAVHLVTGMDIATLILATSPGGVAEMSITARALHLTAPLVTAFHLVRILLIVLLSAPVYRIFSRAA